MTNTRCLSRAEEVMVGTILGDAHIAMLKTAARLEIAHTERQKEYVFWKHQELKSLDPSEPYCCKLYDPRVKKIFPQWRFRTKASPAMTEWRALFYPAGEKIVPENINTLLYSPLSLAVWFMDDGGRRNDSYGMFLNTLSFTKNEHAVLQECLMRNFSIETRLHWIQDGYRLYIPSREVKKFCELVCPYVIPTLQYKLSFNPVTTSFVRLDRARDRKARSFL